MSKKSICEDIFSERKEKCLYCKEEFPVRDLRKHLWAHRSLAATNTTLYGDSDSSDSDSSTGSDILTKSPFLSAVQNEIPEEEQEERENMENPDSPAELVTGK